MCWHCFAPQSPGGIFSIGGTRSDAKRLASWHFTSGQSHCGSQRQTRLRKDAAQTRNVAASQRQTRQRQTRLREDANTSRSVRRDYAKMRTQVATSQRQMRLREDANTSRNVAASDATTRRRRPNSQRRSVAASDATRADATTRTQVATSQRQTRLREEGAETRNVAASQRQAKRQPVLHPHWEIRATSDRTHHEWRLTTGWGMD